MFMPVGISHLSSQSHGRSGDEPRGGPWEVSRRHVHPTKSAGPTNVKENGIKCKHDAHVLLKSSFFVNCLMVPAFTKKEKYVLSNLLCNPSLYILQLLQG